VLLGEIGNKKEIGNHEGKRAVGRPKRRCEDSIKMDLRERKWEDVVMNLIVI
jgi:hypothetical protein